MRRYIQTSRRFMTPLLLVFMVLQSLDFLTTLMGLRMGAVESSTFIGAAMLRFGPVTGLVVSKVIASAIRISDAMTFETTSPVTGPKRNIAAPMNVLLSTAPIRRPIRVVRKSKDCSTMNTKSNGVMKRRDVWIYRLIWVLRSRNLLRQGTEHRTADQPPFSCGPQIRGNCQGRQ